MLTSFGIRFIISNITISLFVMVILLIKRFLKKHISLRIQYNIWFLFLIMLVVPFLPLESFKIIRLNSFLSFLSSFAVRHGNNVVPAGISGIPKGSTNWFQDYSISVNSTAPSLFNISLLIIWLAGASVMLILTLRSNLKIRQLIGSSLPVQNKRVKNLFIECMAESDIKKNITVYSSAFLKSPISLGFFHPRIIIPIHLISDLNEQELRFILLHELQHYRHKDIPINYLTCFARILYWFQPFVWFALKEMRKDRELACDASVLYLLEEDSYMDYGKALIHFAGKISKPSFPFAAGFGGTKKQITKRIVSIASFCPESRWLKIKSGFIFVSIGVLVFSSIPFLWVNAASDRYDFTGSQVNHEDLSSYFNNYDGSFVLYNLNTDNWTIYNETNGIKRISPDSTYKIYSALIGFENGSITPEATELPWDKKIYPYTSWNRDQNLDSAMKNSVNWYFQTLDKNTGKKSLEKYMKLIGYGNENLSGGISRYWLESSLKISPVEQVELLTKFYRNEFHFKDSSIQTVKNSLLQSENSDSALYGKTGTGNIEGKDVNGWFIGFVEKKDNTYFFAANIQAKDKADGVTARNVTLEILKAKQLYTN